jgi:hypothetical protein
LHPAANPAVQHPTLALAPHSGGNERVIWGATTACLAVIYGYFRGKEKKREKGIRAKGTIYCEYIANRLNICSMQPACAVSKHGRCEVEQMGTLAATCGEIIKIKSL